YLFNISDQRHYELCCAGCGRWQEPEFPENVDWDGLAVVCGDCRTTLDPWSEGRWVARRPEVEDVRGYQLNRLCLPDPPLSWMRLALEGRVPTDRETFFRQDLGQPFSSPESRLTPEVLNGCIES